MPMVLRALLKERCVTSGGISYPSSFLTCFEWCAEVLVAETLIGHYILLDKAINMKIDKIIY